MTISRWRGLISALAGTLLLACGGGPDASKEAKRSPELYAYEPGIWPSSTIPVCFTNPELATEEERGWVQEGASRWEQVSALDFTGWGACTAGAAPTGIVITFSDQRPASNVGFHGGAKYMGLNSTYQADLSSCASMDEFTDPRGVLWDHRKHFCMVIHATHEFGHALGLWHEFNRPDTLNPPTPGACAWDPLDPAAESESASFAAWDPYSVMLQSYCGLNSMGYLSMSDIAGAQHYYGHKSDDYLWLNDGDMRMQMWDWADLAGTPHDKYPHQLGVSVWAHQAPAGAQPFTGDFDGDHFTDIFWYRPGAATDHIWWGWFGLAWGTPFPATVTDNVGGTYTPISGDFDCDGRSDIFWYGRGSVRDSVWWGRGDHTFDKTRVRQVSGFYRPVAGDFDGDGCSDIYWYGTLRTSDSVWKGQPDRTFHTARVRDMAGNFYPYAGDFDGDGRTDIFWYALDSTSDGITWAEGSPGHVVFSTRQAFPVVGNYRVAVGDFDGNGTADIFFNRETGIDDHAWLWNPGARTYLDTPATLLGSYQPLTGQFDGYDAQDIFWYGG